MKKINYLIVLFLLVIIGAPKVLSATLLDATNNNPVVGTTFDVKLGYDYGRDVKIAEGHYKVKYDTSCFSFEKVFWSQNGGTYHTEDGAVYIDKEFSELPYWVDGTTVFITFKVNRVCNNSRITIEETAPAKYINGSIVEQTLVPTAVSSELGTNDTQLSNLYISNYDITPAFNRSIYKYSLIVDGNINEVDVKATPGNAKQTVTGAGKKALAYGDNRIVIKVKDEVGNEASYEIMVTRKDNRLKNTALKSLSVSNTNIKVERDKYIYSATVSRSVSSIFISATPESSNSTLTGTGKKDLVIGYNSFDLFVRADDGSTQKYTINITRSTEELQEDITSTNLILLEVNEQSVPLINNQTTYLVGIPKDQDKLNILTVTESKTANTKVSDNENLKVGISSVTITVTEKDDSKKEYKLIVFREPTKTVKLESLDNVATVPEDGTPAFYSQEEKHLISSATIDKIKGAKKTVFYNVINTNGGLLYQVKLNTNMESKETDITFKKASDNPLTYETTIPAGIEVKMYIDADSYKDGNSLRIYTYNEKGQYNILSEGTPVENGYISFITNGDKNYIFTTQQLVAPKSFMSKLADKLKGIIAIIIIGIALLFIISSVINHLKNSKMKDEPLY